MRKFIDTLRICAIIMTARTFGEYKGSGWMGHAYADYKWRGRLVHIPTLDKLELHTRLRFGFRSKRQLPLFMIWREYREFGEVVGAETILVLR